MNFHKLRGSSSGKNRRLFQTQLEETGVTKIILLNCEAKFRCKIHSRVTITVHVRSSAVYTNKNVKIGFWDAYCLHVGNYNSLHYLRLFHATI